MRDPFGVCSKPSFTRHRRCSAALEFLLKPTDITNPDYFHKVVDCQWACPAHTPVPEYIRLIAHGRYSDAYMINWKSNVFPGILGRTCDRPCEPACRRSRVEDEHLVKGKKEPVAICRLKRVAADYKDDDGIKAAMPKAPAKNGKRIACIGGGPASLTVARDLAVLGYEIVIYDQDPKLGGFIRTQIPHFRLPESVIDEEVGYITGIGNIEFRHRRSNSMKAVLAEGYDAVFVGSGAPRGRDLDVPGRKEAAANIHIGLDWLSSVSFGHITKVGKRVIVLGGGNTAMDCCRTARRLGGDDVKVIVRSGFDEMKASPWEKEDAMGEDIPILNMLVPKEVTHKDGKITGVLFEKVKAEYDAKGRRSLIPSGEPDEHHECDDVLVAIGQENAFPWIEKDAGIEFDRWGLPKLNETTLPEHAAQGVLRRRRGLRSQEHHLGGRARPRCGDLHPQDVLIGENLDDRPAPGVNIVSQKMGIHEWSYDNAPTIDHRFKVPHRAKAEALKDIMAEVELGFDPKLAFEEAQRCLNCDVQTVFAGKLCIECDACVDICPMDCITFTENGEEKDLRARLIAPAVNPTQDLYIGNDLKTGRVMVKDEDVCLHCGLCAERCPTGAWDMRKYYMEMTQAEHACRKH